MALTAAQQRRLSRRTTATSRARLRARFGTGATLAARSPLARGVPAPAAPRQPADSGPRGHLAPAAPGIPPRANAQFIPDAQYLAQAAQAQFQRMTQINQINAEHQAAVGTYQEGQRRLMEGVPQQQQNVKEGAAKAGLFYSGQLGKRLGDLETQIARQRADAQSQFQGDERSREAARAAILQGGTIDDAALKAEAVARQLQRDQASAAANRLVPTPVPKPRSKPKPKPKPKPRRRRHR